MTVSWQGNFVKVASGCPQRAAKSPKFRYRLSGMENSSKMEKGDTYKAQLRALLIYTTNLLHSAKNTGHIFEYYETELKRVLKKLKELHKLKK